MSYSLKIAKAFRAGESRQSIARRLNVSLRKVDGAIRRYLGTPHG